MAKFLWGAATAAYQIEGAYKQDEKELSIWDTYTHENRCYRNQTGDVACDHYNRYKEDVKLMVDLGINSYRFSISWCRIVKANGEINQKGLEFYSNLVDELLANSITPVVTLFHWDLPEFIFKKGGFMNRDVVNDFSIYVKAVVDKFQDRVKYYNTINEAQSFFASFRYDVNAPGLCMSKKEIIASMHNILRCHGVAVKIIRENVKDAIIGFNTCGWIPCPAEKTEENIRAAYNKTFSCDGDLPTDGIVVMGDAIYFGKYPQEFLDKYKDDLPEILPGDMELISQPIDVICHNNYSGYYVDSNGKTVDFYDGNPLSSMGWDDIHETVYWSIRFMYERYKLPVIVTENGTAQNDRICLDGKVHDSYRIDSLNRYLNEVQKAKEEGIPVLGYFVWSLMDNFEWKCGYSQRFGLIYVDYRDGKRTKKDSFDFYKNYIKNSNY